MIRPVLLAGLLALLATPIGAVTLALRSGEHDGFTRLVLPIPDGADWTLEQQDRRAALRITGAEIDFDTTGVFDRIPRTRLEALRPGRAEGVLDLILGCDCDVSGFTEGGRYLVIDIAARDTAARPAAPAPLPVNLPVYRFVGLAPTPLPSGPQELGGPGPKPPVPIGAGRSHLPGLHMSDAAERRLIEQILRASGQGLLDLRQPEPVHPMVPAAAGAADRTPEPAQPAHAARNVAIASALDATGQAGPGPTTRPDRLARRSPPESTPGPTGCRCMPPWPVFAPACLPSSTGSMPARSSRWRESTCISGSAPRPGGCWPWRRWTRPA